MKMNMQIVTSAERNRSKKSEAAIDESDDDEASLLLLDLEDSDDLMSLSTYDSSHHQQQSYNSSFGSILSSSRHSLGSSFGSIKKGVRSIAKKAAVGSKQNNYVDLEEIPSSIFEPKELSSKDDLNRISAHSNTTTSDVTNEHSFAGDEEDELALVSPKRHHKVKPMSSQRAKRNESSSSSLASSARARAPRRLSLVSPASTLPRNRKIRSTGGRSQNISHRRQQQLLQQSNHSSQNSVRSSPRKHRHLDTKSILERCTNTTPKTNFNVNTAPRKFYVNTAPNNRAHINTAPNTSGYVPPKSPAKVSPTRGVRRTSLNEYISREAKTSSRERVQFDFNPKDAKSVIQQKGSKKQYPPTATPKIVQPLVDPFVMDLERLSLRHL